MRVNRDRKPRQLVCLSVSLVAMLMTPQLAFAQGSSGSAPVTIVSPLPLPVTVMNPVRQGVVYTELLRAECNSINVCEARFTAAPAGMVLRVTRLMGFMRVSGDASEISSLRPGVAVYMVDGRTRVLHFAEQLPAVTLPLLTNLKSFNIETDVVFREGQSALLEFIVPPLLGFELSPGNLSITATLLPAQ